MFVYSLSLFFSTNSIKARRSRFMKLPLLYDYTVRCTKFVEREPTIRLNIDIPVSGNDRLAEKARKLSKPKTELVRRLLEWALDESSK